MGIVIDFSI